VVLVFSYSFTHNSYRHYWKTLLGKIRRLLPWNISRHYATLVAVLWKRSLSAAAKRCFVAQPSISYHRGLTGKPNLRHKLFVSALKGRVANGHGSQAVFLTACKILSSRLQRDLTQLVYRFTRRHCTVLSLTPFLSGALISQVIKTCWMKVSGFKRWKLVRWIRKRRSARFYLFSRLHSDEDDVLPSWEDDVL